MVFIFGDICCDRSLWNDEIDFLVGQLLFGQQRYNVLSSLRLHLSSMRSDSVHTSDHPWRPNQSLTRSTSLSVRPRQVRATAAFARKDEAPKCGRATGLLWSHECTCTRHVGCLDRWSKLRGFMVGRKNVICHHRNHHQSNLILLFWAIYQTRQEISHKTKTSTSLTLIETQRGLFASESSRWVYYMQRNSYIGVSIDD